jgi:hypothetical protein
VLFDSSLLHQTDPDCAPAADRTREFAHDRAGSLWSCARADAFLEGYANHRINLTLLFGNTDEACLREFASAAAGVADGGAPDRIRVVVPPTGRAADASRQQSASGGSRAQWG